MIQKKNRNYAKCSFQMMAEKKRLEIIVVSEKFPKLRNFLVAEAKFAAS